MSKSDMERLKEEYMNIEIPKELDFMVKKAIKDGLKKNYKKNRYKWMAGAAASAVIFTASLNASPAFANALSGVPVVGNIVKVLTFREYKLQEDTYNADIKVPAIEGLEDEKLQSSLNEKYLEENKKLYEDFTAEIEELKKNGGGHMGVDSGYQIKTDNERILAIGRYVVNTVGSSSTVFKYDTIDKKNQILITLPSLFKDESYVDIISENIKIQMREQMKEDEGKTYWVSDAGMENPIEPFERISNEQSFYINDDSKLVISFDKYEVAPGYMGVIEFVIPTEAIKDILAGDEYIK
ncbi:RsiV family protein [Lutispora saccharofermentans]|uniref:DUF3298 and DUF4163 domain-containing protein n=1 Tax=Lutispora saccharofermentans TaxID=3024236 RepID=A0ABT1NCL1_9FIRM|nr:RsiV family protein [Lutispora saccharofermentans]MCQ1528998.1 DUF3298 and DUF4163 domain-containing protein [Lutispora saccharofermentans]